MSKHFQRNLSMSLSEFIGQLGRRGRRFRVWAAVGGAAMIWETKTGGTGAAYEYRLGDGSVVTHVYRASAPVSW